MLGVCGERAVGALESLGLPVPAAFEVAQAAPGGDAPIPTTVVGLPAIGGGAAGDSAALGRWLVVMPAGLLAERWSALAERLNPVGSAAWRWTDVRSGVARIVPATVGSSSPRWSADTVGEIQLTRAAIRPGGHRAQPLLRQVKRRVFLAHVGG